MSDDERETIGCVCDTLENLLFAAKMPISPSIHVTGLTGGVADVLAQLRALLAGKP